MPQLIKLDTAKLFQEAVNRNHIDIEFSDEDNTLEYEFYYCPEEFGEDLLDHDYGIATRIERKGLETYPAYPQEQLKAYLRKYHRIIVESVYTTSDFMKPEFLFKVHILFVDGRKVIEQPQDTEIFKGQSYEEALEKGLQIGIEHIKS